MHFTRHHPSRSYPHPRQFITGTEAQVLECPGPMSEEIEEYSTIHDTSKWQNSPTCSFPMGYATQRVQPFVVKMMCSS